MSRVAKADSPAPDSDFARLLRSEQELEGRLARAREQARRITAAALEEALRREAALEQELAESAASFQADVERERNRRTEEILAQARVEAARFTSIPADRIERLAALVLDRLTTDRP